MKIAITSQGTELTAALDPRFGRTKYFVIIDTDSDDFEVVDNAQNLNAAQGAGIQAAQNVAELGVEAVVTGNVGPNAFRTLDAAEVKVFLCGEETVQQALDSFKAGALEQVTNPNVKGHWT